MINFDGFAPLRIQIIALAHDIREMADALEETRIPLLRSVHEVVQRSIRLNFLAEGRPKWPELAPSTIRLRGTAHPILRHKSTLFRFATSLTIWSISDDNANMDRLDNLVSYARFHQTGTRFMPMREFAFFTDSDMDNIEDVFDDWMHRITVKPGGWPP